MDIVREMRARAEISEMQGVDYADTPQFMRAAASEITHLREENKVMREALLHIEACGTNPVSVTAAIDAIRVTAMVANHKAALATTGGEG